MSAQPHPVFQAGNTALITGAGSGIGLAVAKSYSKHGMKICLVDKDSNRLSSALAHFPDGSAKTYCMDVSKIDDWADLKVKVEMDVGLISLLHLNAGIGVNSGWEDVGYFRKIMDTNYFGVVNGISTFLPSLRRQSQSTAIIVTGSKQGITNPPSNPAYNASKAAVKSLTEHLSYDLRATPTDVFLLVPGFVYTGLVQEITGAKEKPKGAWMPEQVAEYLEMKMAEGVFYIICPDEETTVEKDRKRMLWSVGDIVEDRPPLSRWREGFKDDAEVWMAKQNV